MLSILIKTTVAFLGASRVKSLLLSLWTFRFHLLVMCLHGHAVSHLSEGSSLQQRSRSHGVNSDPKAWRQTPFPAEKVPFSLTPVLFPNTFFIYLGAFHLSGVILLLFFCHLSIMIIKLRPLLTLACAPRLSPLTHPHLFLCDPQVHLTVFILGWPTLIKFIN